AKIACPTATLSSVTASPLQNRAPRPTRCILACGKSPSKRLTERDRAAGLGAVFGFATVRSGPGRAEPAVVSADWVIGLTDLVPAGAAPRAAAGFLDLLPEWDAWCDSVEAALAEGSAAMRAADEVEFLPPVPAPTVYCAGANYVDHIEEMTGVRPTRGA